MSHFGTGQFDDADGNIERRIQQELRARQATSAASRLSGALNGRSGFTSNADRAIMSSLIAAESAAATSGTSPYYTQGAAAAGAHSPFARPYGALGGHTASAYGVGHSPTDAVTASLYARQRAQYGYGNATASAAERAYGYPGGSHELYAQHFGRSAQEMSLIDRAAAYNAQQRQAEQTNQALLQQASKSPTAGLASSSLSYMQKGTPKIGSPKSAPRQPQQVTSSSTPQSATSPNRGRPRKSLTPIRPPSADKDKSCKSKNGEDHVELQKWYSGCVPLGLEDDKYWLSELQVYLRGNFAEAFGATEEDIAAPMHGRNKPIALGQVGIRCMHCKRKY
jgi:hypothetical protein